MLILATPQPEMDFDGDEVRPHSTTGRAVPQIRDITAMIHPQAEFLHDEVVSIVKNVRRPGWEPPLVAADPPHAAGDRGQAQVGGLRSKKAPRLLSIRD